MNIESIGVIVRKFIPATSILVITAPTNYLEWDKDKEQCRMLDFRFDEIKKEVSNLLLVKYPNRVPAEFNIMGAIAVNHFGDFVAVDIYDRRQTARLRPDTSNKLSLFDKQTKAAL
jgi:hypothetical protein